MHGISWWKIVRYNSPFTRGSIIKFFKSSKPYFSEHGFVDFSLIVLIVFWGFPFSLKAETNGEIEVSGCKEINDSRRFLSYFYQPRNEVFGKKIHLWTVEDLEKVKNYSKSECLDKKDPNAWDYLVDQGYHKDLLKALPQIKILIEIAKRTDEFGKFLEESKKELKGLDQSPKILDRLAEIENEITIKKKEYQHSDDGKNDSLLSQLKRDIREKKRIINAKQIEIQEKLEQQVLMEERKAIAEATSKKINGLPLTEDGLRQLREIEEEAHTRNRSLHGRREIPQEESMWDEISNKQTEIKNELADIFTKNLLRELEAMSATDESLERLNKAKKEVRTFPYSLNSSLLENAIVETRQKFSLEIKLKKCGTKLAETGLPKDLFNEPIRSLSYASDSFKILFCTAILGGGKVRYFKPLEVFSNESHGLEVQTNSRHFVIVFEKTIGSNFTTIFVAKSLELDGITKILTDRESLTLLSFQYPLLVGN